MPIKNFEDLIKEVHEKGICQMCGGCVSFCSSVDYNIIGFENSYSPPVYINKKDCLECGICYYICPQTHLLDDEINKTYNFSDFSSMPIGYVENIYSCQSKDDDFLKCGTDGGVVNSLINFLIEKKKIDGAIVAEMEKPFSRKANYACNKEDLISASGIKLNISPQLEEIQKFNTYVRSIPIISRFKLKKLAVVGTPCQIYTIRCMQDLGVVPSQNIELCLGLFCYENFFFDTVKKNDFKKEFGINFKDIKKINIKKDLIFELKNDEFGSKTVHIPFNRLDNYMRPTCNACYDFSNIYADISFGGLGSPDKYTTVITRTKKGKEIISMALNAGVIKRLNLDKASMKEMKELIIKYSQVKRRRFLDYMNIINSEKYNSSMINSMKRKIVKN